MLQRVPLYSVIALATIVMLVVAACGGGEEPTAAPTAAPPPTATSAPQATAVPTQPPLPTATRAPTPTPGPTATPATVVERPVRGGIFRDRLNQDITRGLSWDAHQQGGIVQIRVVPNIVSGVLIADKFDPGKVLPYLADSWSYSSDGTALTLKFPTGVKYHDGQAFKVSDVIWSYNRIRGAVNTGYISHVKDLFLPYVKSLEAPDEQTLVVRLNFPSQTFLYSVTNLFAVVYAERFGNEYVTDTNKPPIGTGPFKFEERKPDISIKVRRNPTYHRKDKSGEPLPYLDGIDYEIIPDSFTAFSALRVGKFLQGDPFDPGLLNTNIEQFKREFPDWTFGVDFGAWREYVFRNKPPWNDARIRRALDLLIDRPAFVNVVAPGYGSPIASPMLPPELGGIWGLTAQETSRLINTGPVTPQIIAEARRLFQEAGIKFDGFEFEFRGLGLLQYDNDALVLKDHWEKAGLKVNFTIKGGPIEFTQKRISGEFDIYYVPASSAGDDPDFVLGRFFPTGAGENFGRHSDSEIDRLYNLQQRTIDFAKRKEIAQELQRYILTTGNWHPKVAWAGSWQARSPRIRNHTLLCGNAYCSRVRYEDIWVVPEAAR